MGLDRARDTFLEKVCNRSSTTLNKKSSNKKKFEIGAQGKCQSVYFLPNSHFGTFFPVHQFQNFFYQMTSR